MPSLEYDLTFLQAGVPELKNYLLSKEIYWPLGLRSPKGEAPYPRMTLGWLLLALARANGWQSGESSTAKAAAFDPLRTRLEQIRGQWRVAWENKAAQEFRSRLNLWKNFVNEYRNDNRGHASRYPYEVQRRVMLHLLQEETPAIPGPEQDLLRGMDSFIRSALQPGGFVWEQNLAPGFPEGEYWYLYGSLRG